jgi:hypothetical protein
MKRLLVGVCLFAAACGGNDAAPTPAVPAANVSGIGEGSLVLHPSADTRFAAALETPVRVRENSGGSATWQFARMSILLNGVERERNELSRDQIVSAGFGSITANQSQVIRMIFRLNSTNFNAITITLGMVDNKDNRNFNVDVPFSSFSNVTQSSVPTSFNVPRLSRD